jgi:thiamine-phosphate pyrophosphorylase
VSVSHRAGWRPADLACAFLDGGARCVQIRGKDLSSNVFLDLCDTIVRSAVSYGAVVIVNDRPDMALMSGATGVHVGQDDFPSDQIDRAAGQPVNYIAIGPVFGTRTKDTGYEAVGLGAVSEAARRSRGLPVVAIGGITLESAPSVWQAGASSVAVISDLLEGNDPGARVRAYLKAADAHRI